MSGAKDSIGQRLGNKKALCDSCRLSKDGSIAVKSRFSKGRPRAPPKIERVPAQPQNQNQRLSSKPSTETNTPNPASAMIGCKSAAATRQQRLTTTRLSPKNGGGARAPTTH